MNPNQPSLNDVINSPQAADLLKNRQAMENLLRCEETRQLMAMLDQNSDGSLKDAAQSAMKGNTAQLMSLVQGLMNDPNNVRLVEELSKKVGK